MSSDPAIALHFAPGTCPRVPLIALEAIGVRFETRLIAFMAGGHRKPDFLARNPAGKVPVLEFDGHVLTQRPAILAFLAQRFPEAKLLSSTGDLFADAALHALIELPAGSRVKRSSDPRRRSRIHVSRYWPRGAAQLAHPCRRARAPRRRGGRDALVDTALSAVAGRPQSSRASVDERLAALDALPAAAAPRREALAEALGARHARVVAKAARLAEESHPPAPATAVSLALRAPLRIRLICRQSRRGNACAVA